VPGHEALRRAVRLETELRSESGLGSKTIMVHLFVVRLRGSPILVMLVRRVSRPAAVSQYSSLIRRLPARPTPFWPRRWKIRRWIGFRPSPRPPSPPRRAGRETAHRSCRRLRPPRPARPIGVGPDADRRTARRVHRIGLTGPDVFPTAHVSERSPIHFDIHVPRQHRIQRLEPLDLGLVLLAAPERTRLKYVRWSVPFFSVMIG